MFPDYYKQLGLTPDVTKEEIKKTYRKLALEFHPDRNKSADAHEKFIAINEAYLILYDEEARAKYDTEYKIYFNREKTKSQSKYSEQKNKEKERSYSRESHFDDADLNDWSKKAKQQGAEYARMAFDEFSKMVIGFVKETGFQLGNTILVFFGLVLTMGGCGNMIIGLSTSGEIGNPVFGIIMLPIGILLWIAANKNWDKHKT
jgi:curved DNA-binding protein CbpA